MGVRPSSWRGDHPSRVIAATALLRRSLAFGPGAETRVRSRVVDAAASIAAFTQAHPRIWRNTRVRQPGHHSGLIKQPCRLAAPVSTRSAPRRSPTMTQELIANMLGVRREGVTEAAGKLQAAVRTRYSRGRITVLQDRPGLEARALRVLY